MLSSRRTRFTLVAICLGIGLAFWLQDDPAPTSPTPVVSKRPGKERKSTQRRAPAALPASTPETHTVAPEPPEKELPDGSIRCAVEGNLPSDSRFFVRPLYEPDAAEEFGWHRSAGAVVLSGIPETGSAIFRMRGHPRVEFSWSEDGCGPIVLGQTATVRGIVNNAFLEDTERTDVRGCGARGRVSEDGSFELQVSPEPCELVARRRDGPLVAISDSVFLEPEIGEVIDVELDLPRHRLAGVGFSWSLVSGGIEVMEVHADTPASDVGLQSGDTIVEVDGEPTEDMNRGDVRRTIGGQEGTRVQLVVLRGDREIALAFERESLDHALPERDHGPPPGHGKWGKHPR